MPKVKAEAPVELFAETPKIDSGLNINIILFLVIFVVVFLTGYIMYKFYKRLNSITNDLNEIKEIGPQIIHVESPNIEEPKTDTNKEPDDKLKTIKEIPEETVEELPDVETFDVDKD
jgi:predicted PurR-regulated permease PerM